MPTINQFLRKIRKKKIRKIKAPLLMKCPQKRGLCLKLFTTKPKKPNSAQRKVGLIRIVSTSRQVIVGVPGIGIIMQKFGIVLIRGGGFKDVPGVKYKMIRGGDYALNWREKIKRKNARSKFGTPLKAPEFTFEELAKSTSSS